MSKSSRPMLLVAIVGAGLVLAIFVGWRINLAHNVNTKLQAIRAAGLPTSGTELNAYYAAAPDGENAALVMTQAFALIRNYPDNRSNDIDQFQFPTRGQRLTNEQIQLLAGYVEMNSNALAKMVEALKLPKSRYPVDFSPGVNTLLPHLVKIKRLALISEYQALLAIDSTHPSDTDSSVSNILHLAGTLNEEPILISQLVRMALFNFANRTLEQRLNAGELDDTELTNLNDAFTRQMETNLIAQALIGERAMAIPFFRMSLAEIKRLSESEGEDNNMPTGPPLPGPQPMLFRVTGFFERDLLYYLDAMETAISFASLPPPRDLAITNVSETMAEDARNHYCIFSAMFLPSLSGPVAREADGLARIRLATTAIAVERFRLAHGRLPEHLNELVPQFLSTMPDDPFDGQPLRYHRLDKGYVIYSIGSDGEDNGGRERPASVKSTDKTHYDITFIVDR